MAYGIIWIVRLPACRYSQYMRKIRRLSIIAALVLIEGVETVNAANVTNTHAEWRACLNSADCIMLKGVCGGARAINKVKKDEFEAYVVQMNSSVHCATLVSDPSWPEGIRAECQNGECVAVVGPQPTKMKGLKQ